MTGAFKALVAAACIAATASLAGAAPTTGLGDVAQTADSGVLKVHGVHEYCARDRYGWHRHTVWGERRPCRRWRGRGPRPDFCAQVGPLWFCGY